MNRLARDPDLDAVGHITTVTYLIRARFRRSRAPEYINESEMIPLRGVRLEDRIVGGMTVTCYKRYLYAASTRLLVDALATTNQLAAVVPWRIGEVDLAAVRALWFELEEVLEELEIDGRRHAHHSALRP